MPGSVRLLLSKTFSPCTDEETRASVFQNPQFCSSSSPPMAGLFVLTSSLPSSSYSAMISRNPPLNETGLGPRQLPFLRRSPSLTGKKRFSVSLFVRGCGVEAGQAGEGRAGRGGGGGGALTREKLLLMRLLWYLARNPRTRTQLSISRRAPTHAWFRVFKSGLFQDLHTFRISYLARSCSLWGFSFIFNSSKSRAVLFLPRHLVSYGSDDCVPVPLSW